MLNYLVDIYEQTEEIINGEPMMSTQLLHQNVPASKGNLSGRLRYLAAGAGIPLSLKLIIPYFPDVTEMCRVSNIRTREGTALDDQPPIYRVVFANPGERRQHMELDLEALRDES
jgi:hypothetical protein